MRRDSQATIVFKCPDAETLLDGNGYDSTEALITIPLDRFCGLLEPTLASYGRSAVNELSKTDAYGASKLAASGTRGRLVTKILQ